MHFEIRVRSSESLVPALAVLRRIPFFAFVRTVLGLKYRLDKLEDVTGQTGSHRVVLLPHRVEL